METKRFLPVAMTAACAVLSTTLGHAADKLSMVEGGRPVGVIK